MLQNLKVSVFNQTKLPEIVYKNPVYLSAFSNNIF